MQSQKKQKGNKWRWLEKAEQDKTHWEQGGRAVIEIGAMGTLETRSFWNTATVPGV